MRIFYAAGPGNVIQAHRHWMNGQHDPSEMSLTYSSQFAELCRDVGAEAYIVSYHPKRESFRDGAFTLEHRPKPMPGARGLRFHLAEVAYGVSLVATALRFKADVSVISSGSTHYFVASLFRLAGIRPVVVLHNTLWPSGFPPTRLVPRLILWLDAMFFRWASEATLGISPECIGQVKHLTGGRGRRLHQFMPQFNAEYFENIPPPPNHDQRPFRILYAGRVTREKGAFDILEMAKRIEASAPQQVHWEICGSGPDLDELRRQHEAMDLEGIVTIRGWTAPRDMRDMLVRSHASIAPTRSNFTEGMAKTVVEAILSGRPAITNAVVPALEVLRPACVEARPDDVNSYVEVILRLIYGPEYYRALHEACLYLQTQFYDRSRGLRAALREVLNA